MSKASSAIRDGLTDKVIARFWSYVDKGPDCWIWKKGLVTGYPQFYIGQVAVLGHRVSLFLATGELAATGEHTDHICHTPACVRPEHLRIVTASQNAENRAGATRLCKSGIRGVIWLESKQHWYIQAYHHGRRYHGGSFKDLGEAERAVIALRNRLHTHNDMDRVA